MNIRNSLEETASDFVANIALPTAARVREGADELFDRLGTESRQLGSKVGERVTAQVQQLPKATLSQFSLVTAKQSRRRTLMGVLFGVALGAFLVKMFSGEDGARRRHAISSKLGLEDPQSAAAITGDVPK